MKLLTQEEGSQLRVGQKVNLYWFKPRAGKGPEPESRFFDGRQEWVETVWRGLTVSKDAWLSVQDGYAVKVEGHRSMFLTREMELA